MALTLQLNRGGGRPLYRQIAEHIKSRISRGDLPAGSRLPTVRQLAQELEVTRLTVHNAYGELQAGGWVEATIGRGTFVSGTIRPRELMASIGRQATPEDVINNMGPMSQITGLRSLAYAYPDTSLLPVDDFWESLVALRSDMASLMQYGLPQGDPVLRVELASLLQERGIAAMPDDILVTSGITQGLSLVAQALARPGDTVAVETPTYLGFFAILKAQGLQPVGIPRDEEGPRLDVLERVIGRHRPRLFYTIPSFHNPTGTCMSLARRHELLALAEQHELLLVEDDIYGRLSYLEQAPPPLKTLDRADLVIYLDSLSKVLLPGVRIGYVIAPTSLHRQLVSLRGGVDLFGPALLQRAVAHFLRRKKFKQYLRRSLPVYRERRDVLLQTLAQWMPDCVTWTKPEGGFACWVTLPADDRLTDLYQAALNRGVAYTPGSAFLTEPDSHQYLRLCFGNQPPEIIRESVALLSELIQERVTGKISHDQIPVDWMPWV